MKSIFHDSLVLLKGAGDLGTGVAYRLHRAGFPVIITELAQPLVVRRTVAFASAVYDGTITVEGVTARRAESFDEAKKFLDDKIIPVLVDPETHAREFFKPSVLIDAIMAKRNTGTRITDAPFVLALGPGFTPASRVDCHAVIETQRGHNLGRVWWDRPAEPNSGTPGEIGGKSSERVLRAPCDGVVKKRMEIGDWVARDKVIADVGECEVRAPFDGILRGLMHDGIQVKAGMKIGDIDARIQRENCFTISDKSLAIGGGAVEAVLTWMNQAKAG
ncbi:MAG: EF2563 family selenium-dependent molybdenum hydroxylase system protein [Chloroflexi bacterium]|nr:EF2563 family selenium-dependent molybdenum hydroxylase system protein [Chloroflexota bacterium]